MGEKDDPHDKEQEGGAQRAKGRGGNTRSAPPEAAHGKGVGSKSAAANDRASKNGTSGRGDDGDDGDDHKTEAATENRKKKDSMASDAQKLTSEFAAGRLTAPHFFGAMLVRVVAGVTTASSPYPECQGLESLLPIH